MNTVDIFKDNRKYGKKSLIADTTNGKNNYTKHRISFKSKIIGKMMGITYNKDITMESENIFVRVIKSIIIDNSKCLVLIKTQTLIKNYLHII
jgi:hypothetical protein